MTSPHEGITLTVVMYEDVHLAILKQKGDWGDAYQKKAAVVHLSKADLQKLGVTDNARVKLTGPAGSAIVSAKLDTTGEAGVCLIPSSLYTNRLAGYDPALPILPGQHIDIQVLPTEKAITPISDLKVRRNRA